MISDNKVTQGRRRVGKLEIWALGQPAADTPNRIDAAAFAER